MKWINIGGLCLQFFAFWFAAPELLGVESLKRFEKNLVKFVSTLPSTVLGIVGFTFGLGMGYFGMKTGLAAGEEGKGDLIQSMILIGVFSVAYMVYIIFFYKKLKIYIERVFAKPLLEKLINNNETRKTALVSGALLFTIGFLLQLSALLFS